MAVADHGFVAAAIGLDGVSIAHEDGRLIAARDLTDDHVSLEDVIDLAHEHGLRIADCEVDMSDGETRLHLEDKQ